MGLSLPEWKLLVRLATREATMRADRTYPRPYRFAAEYHGASHELTVGTVDALVKPGLLTARPASGTDIDHLRYEVTDRGRALVAKHPNVGTWVKGKRAAPAAEPDLFGAA